MELSVYLLISIFDVIISFADDELKFCAPV